MLTKTQTIRRLPWAVPAVRHVSPQMRSCAAWAVLEEHDKVLDLCCGDGQLLSYLAGRMRLNLCGLCETPEQARAVRDSLLDVDAIPGRMEDIPWREGTFNAVLLSSPLPSDDARRILRETLRVLRVSGHFVLALPLFHVRDAALSAHETMRLMQEIGFYDVSYRATLSGGVIVGWKKAEEQTS